MQDILEVIKSRRSVRNFTSEQIGEEDLKKIIEAGIYAPTGHNEQPWYFTVIQNTELLDHINRVTAEAMAKSEVDWISKMGSRPGYQVTYNAPTVIIVSARKNGTTWEADCSAAIQNMLLEAESLNVGSVWLGLMGFYFSNAEEVKRLQIPEGYEPYFGVSFGRKIEGKTYSAPKRNMDVVSYIR